MIPKIWSKIKLNQIRTDAKKSLYKDFNGRIKDEKKAHFFLYVLPIIVSIAFLTLGIFILENIATYLITGISIFAGLFFGLLFIVNDKYNSRKEVLKDSRYEDTQKYLKRYKIFATQLISQISYAILISIALITLMSAIYFSSTIDWNNLISIIPYENVKISLHYFLIALKYIINGLIFYLCFQFILFVIVILSSTYVMLMDDLEFDPE